MASFLVGSREDTVVGSLYCSCSIFLDERVAGRCTYAFMDMKPVVL